MHTPGSVPRDSDSDPGCWNFEQVPQVTVHRAGAHCPALPRRQPFRGPAQSLFSLLGDEELPLPITADLV